MFIKQTVTSLFQDVNLLILVRLRLVSFAANRILDGESHWDTLYTLTKRISSSEKQTVENL